ncbi:hypothetical protein [Mycoplasma procyoni]|uniref:hypothetical protein n=1 Tax=Mycoplasma procyoni TaxID=568784 RepID=UPI00197B2443|nr:hypothetical protein [Mycoplasma procyoni]MBN3535101.1 hypothetical protein [Mycoplasma procyoni]
MILTIIFSILTAIELPMFYIIYQNFKFMIISRSYKNDPSLYKAFRYFIFKKTINAKISVILHNIIFIAFWFDFFVVFDWLKIEFDLANAISFSIWIFCNALIFFVNMHYSAVSADYLIRITRKRRLQEKEVIEELSEFINQLKQKQLKVIIKNIDPKDNQIIIKLTEIVKNSKQKDLLTLTKEILIYCKKLNPKIKVEAQVQQQEQEENQQEQTNYNLSHYFLAKLEIHNQTS